MIREGGPCFPGVTDLGPRWLPPRGQRSAALRRQRLRAGRAGGVQRYLEERDIGFDVGVTKVPLVSQSCLFDLGVGSKEVRPTAEMAYQACENAGRSAPLRAM